MNFNGIKKVSQTGKSGNYIFSLLILSWNNPEYLKLCVRRILQLKHSMFMLLSILIEPVASGHLNS